MSRDLLNDSPGTTPLTDDELKDLIPKLTTKQELNEWERENILQGREWALRPRQIKGCDPFAEEFVRTLHFRMFDKTWKWAGTYRHTEKNFGVQVFQIREGLVNLLADAKCWLENKMDIDELAMRFHHRMVSIHPFPNGNGRHARLIADIVARKYGKPVFNWGRGDMVATGELRQRYISALQKADAGDVKPLIAFAR